MTTQLKDKSIRNSHKNIKINKKKKKNRMCKGLKLLSNKIIELIYQKKKIKFQEVFQEIINDEKFINDNNYNIDKEKFNIRR